MVSAVFLNALLACSPALINTDSAENTGGCGGGEVEHDEAVYIEHD